MSDKIALKVENLNKYFGKRHIIKDVSLTAYEGEVLGFLGPNGAGKSTTIKMILGLLSVDSGSIEVAGYNVKKDFEKSMENIGGIIENPEMYKTLSGKRNLEMYSKLHNGVTDERISQVVKLVRLENRIGDKVKKYSLGMKQRIGLAQSIMHNPKVLILDEPTNGLDPAGIKELRDILINLAHKEGVCVIVSSHAMAEMEMMCDRVAIIANGSVLGVKTINELKNIEGDVFKFTVDNPEKAAVIINEFTEEKVKSVTASDVFVEVDKNHVPQLVKALVDNEIAVYEVVKSQVSLESAFIRITGGGKTIA